MSRVHYTPVFHLCQVCICQVFYVGHPCSVTGFRHARRRALAPFPSPSRRGEGGRGMRRGLTSPVGHACSAISLSESGPGVGAVQGPPPKLRPSLAQEGLVVPPHGQGVGMAPEELAREIQAQPAMAQAPVPDAAEPQGTRGLFWCVAPLGAARAGVGRFLGDWTSTRCVLGRHRSPSSSSRPPPFRPRTGPAPLPGGGRAPPWPV